MTLNMRMKASGIASVQASFRTIGKRIPLETREELVAAREDVIELAKLQTPVDKFNLEESIREGEELDGAGHLKLEVVAGGMVHGVNVDLYAAKVHEFYELIGKPGPGTREKMAANPGVQIGSGFLTRALETIRETMTGRMTKVVRKIIRQAAQEEGDE